MTDTRFLTDDEIARAVRLDALGQSTAEPAAFSCPCPNRSAMDSRIDPAVWRRFNIHVELPLPAKPERRRILKRYLAPFVLTGDELDALADAFETASPALMRAFCENLKRAIVVGPMANWDMRREPAIERVLNAMRPPHDDGLPRLWAHGTDDLAVRTLQWPLVKEPRVLSPQKQPAPETVVAFPRRGG